MILYQIKIINIIYFYVKVQNVFIIKYFICILQLKELPKDFIKESLEESNNFIKKVLHVYLFIFKEFD